MTPITSTSSTFRKPIASLSVQDAYIKSVYDLKAYTKVTRSMMVKSRLMTSLKDKLPLHQAIKTRMRYEKDTFLTLAHRGFNLGLNFSSIYSRP